MKRNRLHSICPYYAVFPESFARIMVLAHSDMGDVVFDPFCGRGTAVLEGLLLGREGGGSDINPVAVCISRAKCAPPKLIDVLKRLRHLEALSDVSLEDTARDDEFFALCFSEGTLGQLLYLRRELRWDADPIDCFITAVALGCLHGESDRSPHYFSNRMPRTISTKPEYSIRWWRSRGMLPPQRDVFAILRTMLTYRLSSPAPPRSGLIERTDARRAHEGFRTLHGRVRLVLTSPPYLDTTRHEEDQWLRQWFLGGSCRPTYTNPDDRHVAVGRYWSFLTEAWGGLDRLLAPEATIVIRIGGARLEKPALLEGLSTSLENALARTVRPLDPGWTSESRSSQTRAFSPRPDSSVREHDFRFAVCQDSRH
jgi:hypothetical protein